MGCPWDFLHLGEFNGPATGHIEKVAETVQVALNRGIHFVSLDKRHHRSFGTTTDRATHLQSGSSLVRSLHVESVIRTYGNRKGRHGRKLGIELVDPLLEDSDVIFRKLGLFYFVCTVIKRRREKYELAWGGVAIAAPKSKRRLWIWYQSERKCLLRLVLELDHYSQIRRNREQTRWTYLWSR